MERAFIMLMLTTYPQAATLDDAIAAHEAHLRQTVAQAQDLLRSAEADLEDFAKKYRRGAIAPLPVVAVPIVAPAPKAAQQPLIPSYRRKMTKPFTRRRLLPPNNESRTRAGSDILEYRYVSGEYIALAGSVPMGTPEGEEAVWLSEPEIDSIREVVRNRKEQRDIRR